LAAEDHCSAKTAAATTYIQDSPRISRYERQKLWTVAVVVDVLH